MSAPEDRQGAAKGGADGPKGREKCCEDPG